MTRRVVVIAILAVLGLGVVAFGVSRVIERLARPAPVSEAGTTAPPADTAQVPHINATLYFADPTGESLVPVRREVPLAEGIGEQGRQIVTSLVEAAAAPLMSVIPKGTTVRGFYMTDQGDAFVDLGASVSTGHPGGSTTELLTVYAIVNTVATNLPSAKRVQILIEGKEVDTLAGHVDLRRPLEPNMGLVRTGEGR